MGDIRDVPPWNYSKCVTELNSRTAISPRFDISNTETDAFFIPAVHSSPVIAQTRRRLMLSCPTRSTVSSE